MVESLEDGRRGDPASATEDTAGDARPVDLLVDDEPVDLSDLRWDDGPVLLLFWVLAFVVFLQFFTRYVLNDSLGWTEEIARYLLVGVAFVGSILAVRKNTHISVEFFYRYLPYKLRRILMTFVDGARIVFFVAMTVICIKLADRTNQKMASIELSKAVIYWGVSAAFAVMVLYSIRITWLHWKKRAITPSPDAAHANVMD